MIWIIISIVLAIIVICLLALILGTRHFLNNLRWTKFQYDYVSPKNQYKAKDGCVQCENWNRGHCGLSYPPINTKADGFDKFAPTKCKQFKGGVK